jgi:3-hydroxyisobutyrate dehydrogenase-like beta-hydroxyacid dehydrogenase
MSTAVYTEMMIVAKKAGLDPAGILDALPLLAPDMGTPPSALAAEVLTGRYRSGLSSRRMQEDIGRLLDSARAAAAPTPLASLVQNAYTSAGHSLRATGDHLDVARWMAENAGVELGASTSDTKPQPA